MAKNKIDAKSIEIKTESKQVEKWLNRISIAEKKHQKQFIDKAKIWRDFYKGNHFPDIADKSNLIVINYTYSILKAIIPQIYFQDPYFYVTATKFEYSDRQKLVEDALNDTWRTLKIKRQMKRIILDMLVMGFGIGKIGYQFIYDKDLDKKLETQLEFTEFVKNEYPYFLRQSPFDVAFDFEAKSFDDLRWLAACYYVPLDELKDKYGSDVILKGNYIAGGELAKEYLTYKTNSNLMDEDLKRVKIWEIQDFTDGKIYTITDEAKDKFLLNMKNPYNLQSNYRILFVNEIPDELYPISDIENLKDINLWMNKVNSMLMQDIMKSQRKILVEEDAFVSEEEEQKFFSGEDLQKCKLNSGAISGNKIMITGASAISPDYYRNNELCKDHLNNVSGVGTSQRGVSDNVERRTAYEASIIDRNSQLRNSERLDAITDYCINVASDLLKVMQQFGSKEVEFFAEKSKKYLKWKKEDIQGDYNIKIEIGSTVRRDNASTRQFILQFASQVFEAVDNNGIPIVDKREFVKLVLEKFDVSLEDINRIMFEPEQVQPQIPEQLSAQVLPQQQAGINPNINVEEILKQYQNTQQPQENINLTPEELEILQGV